MLTLSRSLLRSLAFSAYISGTEVNSAEPTQPVELETKQSKETKPKRTSAKTPKAVDPSEIIRIFTDGASRKNPGKAGIGFVFYDGNGNICLTGCQYIGIQTNNYAEYTALNTALQVAIEKQHKHIAVYADSQLMVKQVNGDYSVKHPNIIPLYFKTTDLIKNFATFSITSIGREHNKKADTLANQAIDMGYESLNIK
jgi:ribonuclease HI